MKTKTFFPQKYFLIIIFCLLAIKTIADESPEIARPAAAASHCKIPADKNFMIIRNPVRNQIIGPEVEEVPRNTPLAFSCESGYYLKGYNETICKAGNKWTTPWPRCLFYCSDEHPKSGFSTKSFFQLDGIDVSNADRFEPGTVATISCANNFAMPEYFEETLRCTPNDWHRAKVPCEMSCGKPIAPITPFSSGGRHANITEVPWHVGIFNRTEHNDYENICGGVIVSPRVVVSAAHCFFKVRRNKFFRSNFSTFAVVAGKYYRDFNSRWESKKSIIEQREILSIWTPDDYEGFGGNFLGDIAIIKLTKHIPFSETIRPVCLFQSKEATGYSIDNGMSGKLSTWGQISFFATNSTLKILDMASLSLEQCNSSLWTELGISLPSDKFCLAPFNTGVYACKGDSGSGFVIKDPVTNAFVLYGIVSFSPTMTKYCSHNNLLVVTNVLYYKNIIESFRKEDLDNDVFGIGEEKYDLWLNGEKKSYCKIPVTTGYRSIQNFISGTTVQAGTRVSIHTALIFNCDKQFVLKGNNLAICGPKGNWQSPLPTCETLCNDVHPRSGITTVAKFTHDDLDISNATRFQPGTIAHIMCAYGYDIPLVKLSVPNFHETLKCTPNGWTPKKLPCVMTCGQPIQLFPTLRKSAMDTPLIKVPWHVSIYNNTLGNEDDIKPRHEFICLGTIISARLIITATSCFYGVQITDSSSAIDLSTFLVATRKNFQELNSAQELNADRMQLRKIIKLWTPHNEDNENALADISIVKLEQHISFFYMVRPACLHLPRETKANSTTVFEGNLATYCKNSQGVDQIQALRMSTLSKDSCHVQQMGNKSQVTDFIQSATIKNPICAAKIGGGFVIRIPETNQFRLYGIVTPRSPNTPAVNCTTENLTSITKILHYKNTLESLLEEETQDDIDYT